MAPEQFVTVNDIADRLRLNMKHVRDRLTKRPDFPRAYVVGCARRWDKGEVEDWIEAQREAPDGRRVRDAERYATTP